MQKPTEVTNQIIANWPDLLTNWNSDPDDLSEDLGDLVHTVQKHGIQNPDDLTNCIAKLQQEIALTGDALTEYAQDHPDSDQADLATFYQFVKVKPADFTK